MRASDFMALHACGMCCHATLHQVQNSHVRCWCRQLNCITHPTAPSLPHAPTPSPITPSRTSASNASRPMDRRSRPCAASCFSTTICNGARRRWVVTVQDTMLICYTGKATTGKAIATTMDPWLHRQCAQCSSAQVVSAKLPCSTSATAANSPSPALHLRGNAGMVGAGQPERGAAPHALVPRHDVLRGAAGAAGGAR